MRRLAGSLIYFFFGLIFVYTTAWVLITGKTDAQVVKVSLNGDVLAKTTAIKPIIKKVRLTPTPRSKPTFIPTPTPRPTITPKPTPKPTLTPMPKPITPTTVPTSSVSDFILSQINDYRASNGLSRVSSNNETCSFASIRAGEISSNFNHDGFTNRINSHSLPYSGYSTVTENIAMTSDYKNVVNMWINSAPHAENMRKDTPYICVAQNGDYFAYEGFKP